MLSWGQHKFPPDDWKVGVLDAPMTDTAMVIPRWLDFKRITEDMSQKPLHIIYKLLASVAESFPGKRSVWFFYYFRITILVTLGHFVEKFISIQFQ